MMLGRRITGTSEPTRFHYNYSATPDASNK
jgi:hypothetical protein